MDLLIKYFYRILRARQIVHAALLLSVALCFLTSAQAQDRSLEYAVKATYLYKFEPFIEWPAGTFSSASAPLTICIVGHDPFGNVIGRSALSPRPIVVHRLETVVQNPGCHILFASGTPRAVQQTLTAVKGTPILTVTELDPDSGVSGIINFVTLNQRVRFQIDNNAAVESGLVLSAKLLALAISTTSARRSE